MAGTSRNTSSVFALVKDVLRQEDAGEISVWDSGEYV